MSHVSLSWCFKMWERWISFSVTGSHRTLYGIGKKSCTLGCHPDLHRLNVILFLNYSFWDYYLITIFLPFLFYPQTLPCTPFPLSIKLMASFLLIVIACVYVFTYIFLSTNYLVHVILNVCMFLGMTIWCWKINWCVRPRVRPPLLFPGFLSCLCFSCRDQSS